MTITDISMAIHGQMATYKGNPDKRPQLTAESVMPQDSANESSIHMNLHTGTHMDAPRHMMQDGWTIDRMPLSRLITRCRVLDLTAVSDAITREDLTGHGIKPGEFILLKTQNSFGRVFGPDFIYIRADAASYLAGCGISGIGTDALGVERNQPGHETHLAFMQHDVLILEGLNLKEAQPGSHILIVLPLNILGAEGAPARAVLVDSLDGI